MLKSVRAHTTSRSFDALVLALNIEEPNKEPVQGRLTSAGWSVCYVNEEGSKRRQTHAREDELMHVWRLSEYDTVIYMDTDLLAVNNVDYLLNEAPTRLQANRSRSVYKIVAPRHIRNGEWTDQFGLGLFIIRPDQNEFNKIVEFKRGRKAKKSGGVGLPFSVIINSVYKHKWFELGFEYAADIEIYSERMYEWLDKERATNISMLHYTVSESLQKKILVKMKCFYLVCLLDGKTLELWQAQVWHF